MAEETRLKRFDDAHKRSPFVANRLLFEWLCDDVERAGLYRELLDAKRVLKFQSRADRKERPPQDIDSDFRQDVYLLTRREDVKKALTTFSNDPYRALGAGTFMLGLDDVKDPKTGRSEHDEQRDFAKKYLHYDKEVIDALAIVAFRAAAVLPLKHRSFDLADLAEQAALRFAGFLFGFAQADHVLLQETMRAAYRGLNNRIVGRHFITELGNIIATNAAMAELLRRATALIGVYSVPVEDYKKNDLERLEAENLEKRRHHEPEDLDKLKRLQDELAELRRFRKSLQREDLDERQRLHEELKELRRFDEKPERYEKSEKPEDRKEPQAGNAAAGGDKAKDPYKPLGNFEPVMKRIAEWGKNPQGGGVQFSGTELGVIVVGLIAGTIGNVQSGVCAAIKEIVGDEKRSYLNEAKQFAGKAQCGDAVALEKLGKMVWEALRLNPPAAFLPREVPAGAVVEYCGETIPAGTNVILAMGAATRDLQLSEAEKEKRHNPDEFHWDRIREPDELIFGGPENPKTPQDAYLHQCVGQHLAMPLIMRIVRNVLMLDGLTRSYDPRTGEVQGLEKQWGVMCRRFPLEYNREFLLKQSPLIVIMRVKSPVAVHAEALKAVIKYGAPRIEKKLRDANHVHFASFIFIENDTKLMLQTVYDRDFDSYIEHFATDIGPLFDRIFEHIEDAPPMPVDEFPKEFVDTIRRFNNSPVGGYFFSAYPLREVGEISGISTPPKP